MQVLRNIYTVQNNQIIIDLPKSFYHKSVEVIILPLCDFPLFQTKKKSSFDKSERLKRLLSISVWDETEIQQIQESRNFINQWKIKEF